MIARAMRVKDIADAVRGEIKSSKLPPGAALLSSKELAARYDTSALTAHRALKALVEEGLVYSVRGSGTFVAGAAAKTAKKLKVGLGFDIRPGGTLEDAVAYDVFPDTMAAALRQGGHDVSFLAYNDLKNPDYRKSLRGFDGLIVAKGFVDPRTSANLESVAAKTVMTQGEEISPLPFHQALPDLRPGYLAALRRLRELGVERMTVAHNGERHQMSRVDALRSAAAELGMDPERIGETILPRRADDKGQLSGARLAAEIMERNVPRPAIFSVSDFVSFGIMDALLKSGRKPGGDFLLVSYDNLEGDGLLPFGRPVLSSVTYPRKEIAMAAVRLLLDVVANNYSGTVIRRLPTSFIPRESTEGEPR